MADQTLMQRPADKPAAAANAAQLAGPRHAPLAQLAADLNDRWSERAGAMQAPNRTGLPDTLKAGVEALSGISLDQVRVHRNSPRPAQLQAHAFAQGSDVHLAPGQDHQLPHEVWHVVQQAQGRVQPTVQMKDGLAINNDRSLEREADEMGARAASLTPDARGTAPVQQMALERESPPLQASGLDSSSAVVVQRAYGLIGYVPDLMGLTVPGGGGKAYNYDTFTRPPGWYANTLDALFAHLPEEQKRYIPELNLQLARCGVAHTWHNINDMQIGHVNNWRDYVQETLPQTVREATNAYNDLNNLRLESATANASHDFEGGRDSEDEDEYDMNDSLIDDSGGGNVMSDEARLGLDQFKASMSNTYN